MDFSYSMQHQMEQRASPTLVTFAQLLQLAGTDPNGADRSADDQAEREHVVVVVRVHDVERSRDVVLAVPERGERVGGQQLEGSHGRRHGIVELGDAQAAVLVHQEGDAALVPSKRDDVRVLTDVEALVG